ncbi:DUF418 domain-containing protein [Oceanobacillus sp. Castelsardo]|uniref:DUF418 domain-containing protein n=1 Tax=Oceanobacillus sp. Castelsardo TaxID=1851204 RepID=UPI000B338778
MKKRVNTIDGLRGFSLIGILIANMLIFQYGMFGKDKMENFNLSAIDQVAYIWTKIFVESSFMPIFMFMFGYSMIFLQRKLVRNEKKVKRHFVRRFILLIIFGLLHATFVWEGDILFSYGIMGLLMLIFQNRKKKTILVWAILLFVITSLLSIGEVEETAEELEHQASYIQKETTAYSVGDYQEVYNFRNSGEDPFGYPDYVYALVIFMAPLVTCPMFLFGMYAAKSNWFTNPKREKKLYTRFILIFLPIGFVLKSVPYLFPGLSVEFALYTTGATLLSIGYIFSFSLLYTKQEIQFLSFFEKVGKLSLSNYLLQSIICTVIFYEYGLGLFRELGVLYGIILAIFIYGIQVILSHYYLKKWRLGPFEKILRIGTYLSWKGNPKRKEQVELEKIPVDM